MFFGWVWEIVGMTCKARFHCQSEGAERQPSHTAAVTIVDHRLHYQLHSLRVHAAATTAGNRLLSRLRGARLQERRLSRITGLGISYSLRVLAAVTRAAQRPLHQLRGFHLQQRRPWRQRRLSRLTGLNGSRTSTPTGSGDGGISPLHYQSQFSPTSSGDYGGSPVDYGGSPASASAERFTLTSKGDYDGAPSTAPVASPRLQ